MVRTQCNRAFKGFAFISATDSNDALQSYHAGFLMSVLAFSNFSIPEM